MSATYIKSKLDNRVYCKDNGHFTKHLRKHNITYQQYYEKYITGIEETCPHCGNPKAFYQKNESYATTCGDSVCVGKEISITKQGWTEEEKLKDSNNKKAAIARRTKEFYKERRKRIERTSIDRYGTAYPTQSANVKERSRKTKLEKYGDEHYSGWEKSAEKNRNKSVAEQNQINEKRRETNMSVFGVSCVFLLPDNKSKSMKSNSYGKEYILPSGKVANIRGYENTVLDVLFSNGYTEEDILFHNKSSTYSLPTFDYVNFNMHNTRYFPDIYIPEESRIIEVKSQWWWDGYGREKYKGRLVNNQRKADSVTSAGYLYEVWLFDNKKEYRILKYEPRIV